MPIATLTVTYADGTSTQQRTSNVPDARRALLKLVNRNGWHINGTGAAGKLLNRAGSLAACYLIHTQGEKK